MKHLMHLIDDTRFKFIPDLDEIGHYEIANSKKIPRTKEGSK